MIRPEGMSEKVQVHNTWAPPRGELASNIQQLTRYAERDDRVRVTTSKVHFERRAIHK